MSAPKLRRNKSSEEQILMISNLKLVTIFLLNQITSQKFLWFLAEKSPLQKSSSSWVASRFLELPSGLSLVTWRFYLLGVLSRTGWFIYCLLSTSCSLRSIFSSNRSSLEKKRLRTDLMSFILPKATFICRYLFYSASFFYLSVSN